MTGAPEPKDPDAPYDATRPANHATIAVAQRIAALTPFAKGYLLALLSDHFESADIDSASKLSESAFEVISDIAVSAPRDVVALLVEAQRMHTRRVSLIEAGADYYLSGPEISFDLGDDGLYQISIIESAHNAGPQEASLSSTPTPDATEPCGHALEHHAASDCADRPKEPASRGVHAHCEPTRKVPDDRLSRP